jgi:hypothetical protein
MFSKAHAAAKAKAAAPAAAPAHNAGALKPIHQADLPPNVRIKVLDKAPKELRPLAVKK